MGCTLPGSSLLSESSEGSIYLRKNMLSERASLVAQTVENLPEMLETWVVASLGWEDPLEKGMATHSSNLAWRIPQTEEPGGLSPWGSKELDTTEQLTHFHTHPPHTHPHTHINLSSMFSSVQSLSRV